MAFVKKLVCLGDEGVGKAELLGALRADVCPARLVPNQVGAYAGTITLDGGAPSEPGKADALEAWVSDGVIASRVRSFYRTADVVVLAYDTTSFATFASLRERWLPEVLHGLPPSCHGVILVGLRAERIAERAVAHEQLAELASLHLLPFLEVSASDGLNIHLLKRLLAVMLANVRPSARESRLASSPPSARASPRTSPAPSRRLSRASSREPTGFATVTPLPRALNDPAAPPPEAASGATDVTEPVLALATGFRADGGLQSRAAGRGGGAYPLGFESASASLAPSEPSSEKASANGSRALSRADSLSAVFASAAQSCALSRADSLSSAFASAAPSRSQSCVASVVAACAGCSTACARASGMHACPGSCGPHAEVTRVAGAEETVAEVVPAKHELPTPLAAPCAGAGAGVGAADGCARGAAPQPLDDGQQPAPVLRNVALLGAAAHCIACACELGRREPMGAAVRSAPTTGTPRGTGQQSLVASATPPSMAACDATCGSASQPYQGDAPIEDAPPSPGHAVAAERAHTPTCTEGARTPAVSPCARALADAATQTPERDARASPAAGVAGQATCVAGLASFEAATAALVSAVAVLSTGQLPIVASPSPVRAEPASHGPTASRPEDGRIAGASSAIHFYCGHRLCERYE
ncbi:hypothetical protein KFE25_006007 [Diacronema lutheri]|uniref:Uncharacterized protein n=1 Tax=Diacronema lutheri TaxID=2081491 RepID=A0A8J6CC59_DIALT|nr:hypothetical protein KFE25_006007 [Diacronema lutheri]